MVERARAEVIESMSPDNSLLEVNVVRIPNHWDLSSSVLLLFKVNGTAVRVEYNSVADGLRSRAPTEYVKSALKELSDHIAMELINKVTW
jgi:hypothetical protein